MMEGRLVLERNTIRFRTYWSPNTNDTYGIFARLISAVIDLKTIILFSLLLLPSLSDSDTRTYIEDNHPQFLPFLDIHRADPSSDEDILAERRTWKELPSAARNFVEGTFKYITQKPYFKKIAKNVSMFKDEDLRHWAEALGAHQISEKKTKVVKWLHFTGIKSRGYLATVQFPEKYWCEEKQHISAMSQLSVSSSLRIQPPVEPAMYRHPPTKPKLGMIITE